ncbi:MAG: hypothetical protein RSB76_03090 [Clostridia bacterium]
MKKYLIAIIFVLLIVDGLIIGALCYLNNKNKGNEVNILANVDKSYNEEKKNAKGNIYSDIITEYIIETQWLEKNKLKATSVTIMKRIKDDKIFLNVIPTADELGSYEIMKDTNNGYGVVSYKSNVKDEELYRCFIKDGKVVAVSDFKRNVWYESQDKSTLTSAQISTVEKVYKYYINFDVEENQKEIIKKTRKNV